MNAYDTLMLEAIPQRLATPPSSELGPTAQLAIRDAWLEDECVSSPRVSYLPETMEPASEMTPPGRDNDPVTSITSARRWA